jgi:hypothetical protein
MLTFSQLNGMIYEMSKIDLQQLSIEISNLNRHKRLYKVLRDELSKIGHWKLNARGNPIKAYQSRGKNKNG